MSLKGKVNFDYTAQAVNQITLKKDSIITIILKGEPGGWSKGQDETGSQFRLTMQK